MLNGYIQKIKPLDILTEKQVERILKIVRDFELDFYTEEIELDYKRLENL